MAAPETNGEGRFYIDAAMKAAEWERAKGHLRALVGIQGSYSGGATAGEKAKWEELSDRVEAFIADVEGDALHE